MRNPKRRLFVKAATAEHIELFAVRVEVPLHEPSDRRGITQVELVARHPSVLAQGLDDVARVLSGRDGDRRTPGGENAGRFEAE